ncbi:LuxR family transcriptional regulator [Streptomyces qinglanensis]|uniref:LuxR family transcriptional regulator n=1 Tax=Streptomyces qinglanensis TaxID=943816 RepID=A0A1E7KDU3_9ACTN|nr:response regulator transcription factor [Streptomyces qinglanensis]OEV02089.1 LuxR family transcriptional regulator [Streptomyces qinglanensis]OEV24884.1 LuxR family transcriptional regulator [Streptomyces nanshensis]
MPENGRIRVYLVDDHEIVRRGVRDMLTADPGVEIAGEAGTAAAALTGIAAARPDVAILDVRLPDGSGIEVCREVRSRDESVRCLMLTSYADDEALLASVVAGASGYVLKGLTGGELLHAVHQVAAGVSLLDPADTRRVLDRLRDRGTGGPPDERLSALSAQERTILGLIGEGLTNRAIGERLHLAEKTVKNYVSGLLGKLGMERRSQAAAYIARIRAAHDD